nr:MFS transporter [Affinibrenneria salicis]
MSQAAAPDPASVRIAKRAAIASMTGTAIEYYEFGIYGFMAVIIGPLFFPGDNPAAALLSILAVFGSAFFIRPLGGILLGRIGDRIGRRKVLLLTVIGMGGATAAIGMLPVTASIGIAAPILLVCLRLIQGFFAGGEIIGAAAFVAESSPTGRRGFYGSFTPVGVALGGALAAIICGLVTTILDAQQLQAWGWRIPFLLTLPLVLFSVHVRHHVEETPAFKQFISGSKKVAHTPFMSVLRGHSSALIRVVMLTFGQNAGYWIGVVFMNIYLTTYLGYEKQHVFWLMAALGLCVAAMMPFWGGLSDRLGRRKLLLTGFVGYVVIVIPMMLLMDSHNIWIAALAMLIATLPMPIIQSVGYPTYAEQFPTPVRYTAMAISINLGAILGGGITPYLVTALINKTGILLMPGFFMAFAALFSLFALLRMRDTHKDSLK